MAGLAPGAAPWLGLAVGGTVMSAAGQIQQGAATEARSKRQADIAEFEARQLDRLAGREKAASQRTAKEERRQSELRESRALAVAAASGAGASDPTVVKILSDLAGEGSYRAALALYEGEERARLTRLQATGKRFEAGELRIAGKEAKRAGKLGALSTLFQGGAGLYGKYGIPGTKSEKNPTYSNPSF